MKEEIAKGYQTPPASRAAMDARYGRGMWRPLPLFVVTQSSGKHRLIADGGAGQNDQHITGFMALLIISASFAPHAARTVLGDMPDVAGHAGKDSPIETQDAI